MLEKDQINLELLKRLMISHADIQMALSAITFLEEVDHEETYSKVELRRFKCYETTFIVSYSRPFTRSKGSHFDRLPLKRIGVKWDADEAEMHARIKNLRDRIYAHSDEAFAHVRLDVFRLDVRGTSMTVPHTQFDEGLEFAEFKERLLAQSMMHKLLDGIFRASQELSDQLGERLPIYLTPKK